MNKITVIGSINVDTNLRVKRMVRPGETIHASAHYTAAGGKGANQAVAAVRSGAGVSFIGAVGTDAPGAEMLNLLKKEGIDTSGIKIITGEATGQAFIMVDDQGQNSITIYGGANDKVADELIFSNENLLTACDFVIAQFETPVVPTIKGFAVAREAGAKTILNPAPAMTKIPKKLLQITDLIVPNETEAETITGVKVSDEESAKAAATKFHNLGIQAVIITLGAKGAFYDFQGHSEMIPAFKVKAVDTTAAGDTFIGAMTSVLKSDLSNLSEALIFANKASSLTVQNYGAQPSIPYKKDINKIK